MGTSLDNPSDIAKTDATASDKTAPVTAATATPEENSTPGKTAKRVFRGNPADRKTRGNPADRR